MMWLNLKWVSVHAEYRAERSCRLPPYKGTTLRGALGYALREVACLEAMPGCEGCASPARCAYGALYESAVDAAGTAGSFDRPMPYVLSPPLDDRQDYAPGDRLELVVCLIGTARRWLPKLIEALVVLGQQGLGVERSCWTLARLGTKTPQGPPRNLALHAADLVDQAAVMDAASLLASRPLRERVTLQFLTPTHLTDKGQIVTRLDGSILARRLLRRIGGLAENYCGESLDQIDFNAMLTTAARLTCADQRLHLHSWDRYSSRRGHKHALSGIVGEVTLSGVDESLWPLLLLGEQLHLGKGASFGMGKYQIVS